MASNENTELVERFYAEAINQKDSTACERLLTDDFVHNNEFRGGWASRLPSTHSSPPSRTSR